MDLEGMHADIFDRSRLDGQGHECELQIRLPDSRAAAQKPACLKMIRAREATEAGEPAQAGQYFPNASIRAKYRHRLQAAVLDDEVPVVVEGRAHRRQLDARFDAGGGKLGGSADP